DDFRPDTRARQCRGERHAGQSTSYDEHLLDRHRADSFRPRLARHPRTDRWRREAPRRDDGREVRAAGVDEVELWTGDRLDHPEVAIPTSHASTARAVQPEDGPTLQSTPFDNTSSPRGHHFIPTDPASSGATARGRRTIAPG